MSDTKLEDAIAQGTTSAEQDVALKERELALKERAAEWERKLREREVILKENDAATQERQNRWSWLTSPAVVAIIAGLIGYIGTLVSSYSTRRLEADRQAATEKLDQENREATLRLNREKQEGTLILEAIKTGGTAEQKERVAAELGLPGRRRADHQHQTGAARSTARQSR